MFIELVFFKFICITMYAVPSGLNIFGSFTQASAALRLGLYHLPLAGVRTKHSTQLFRAPAEGRQYISLGLGRLARNPRCK